MTTPGLYATPSELADVRRRLAAHAWYARCFDNLRAPADRLLRRGISIPLEKGFVFYETCPADDTPLTQDPFDPVNHPCPTCGRNYTDEPYRRAIHGIRGRLAATARRLLDDPPNFGVPLREPYPGQAELLADLDVLDTSLRAAGDDVIADERLAHLRSAVEVFGFHLSALDLRQNSEVHGRVVAELLAWAGVTDDYEALPEDRKVELLTRELATR